MHVHNYILPVVLFFVNEMVSCFYLFNQRQGILFDYFLTQMYVQKSSVYKSQGGRTFQHCRILYSTTYMYLNPKHKGRTQTRMKSCGVMVIRKYWCHFSLWCIWMCEKNTYMCLWSCLVCLNSFAAMAFLQIKVP